MGAVIAKPPVCPECWAPMQRSCAWRQFECTSPHGGKGLVTVGDSQIEERGGVDQLRDEDFERHGGPHRRWR